MSSAGCVARSGTTEHLINSEYNPEKIPKWYGVRTEDHQYSPAATPLGSDVQHGEFLHGHRDFFFHGNKSLHATGKMSEKAKRIVVLLHSGY